MYHVAKKAVKQNVSLFVGSNYHLNLNLHDQTFHFSQNWSKLDCNRYVSLSVQVFNISDSQFCIECSWWSQTELMADVWHSSKASICPIYLCAKFSFWPSLNDFRVWEPFTDIRVWRNPEHFASYQQARTRAARWKLHSYFLTSRIFKLMLLIKHFTMWTTFNTNRHLHSAHTHTISYLLRRLVHGPYRPDPSWFDLRPACLSVEKTQLHH